MIALTEAADPTLSRLVVAEPVAAHPDAVARVLAAPGLWLGEPQSADSPPGMERYAADLRLRVGDHVGLTTFRKAAYVDVGTPVRTPHGWQVDIGWRAATLAPLFPVFSGQLHIGADRLELSGIYAPPGGFIGRVADRALLHLAASGTARWLLRQVIEAAEVTPQP